MSLRVLSQIFEWKITRYIFYIGCLVFLTSLFFPREIIFGRELSFFAPHTALIMLLCGLFFLTINQKVLMYFAFATSVITSLQLKYTTNNDINYQALKAGNIEFTVAMIDLSTLKNETASLKHFMDTTTADVIAFQELTPLWSTFLERYSHKSYSHSILLERPGIYGLGFLSRREFTSIDTFYSEEIPILNACIAMSNDLCVNIVNMQTMPIITKTNYPKLTNQLELVGKFINSREEPTICLGDFNMVSWDVPIKKFKEQTTMKDAWVGFIPISLSDKINSEFISPRMQHLFHTRDLGAYELNNLVNHKNNKIFGLKANIQVLTHSTIIDRSIIGIYQY